MAELFDATPENVLMHLKYLQRQGVRGAGNYYELFSGPPGRGTAGQAQYLAQSMHPIYHQLMIKYVPSDYRSCP